VQESDAAEVFKDVSPLGGSPDAVLLTVSIGVEEGARTYDLLVRNRPDRAFISLAADGGVSIPPRFVRERSDIHSGDAHPVDRPRDLDVSERCIQLSEINGTGSLDVSGTS
jgi:hypothetical protein